MKRCNKKRDGRNIKKVKQDYIIDGTKKQVNQKENPDSYNTYNVIFQFKRIDKGGSWAFNKEKCGMDFWDKVLPKINDIEKMTWNEVLVVNKKKNHSIEIDQLNKCAQDRLKVLKIYDDEICSLRIEGKIRLYGLRDKEKFNILWYDDNHGDNDSCVCRSRKKYT